MTTIGPRQPEVESLQEYIDRVVHAAPRPSPEQLTRLADLLRSGDHLDGQSSVVVDGAASRTGREHADARVSTSLVVRAGSGPKRDAR